LLVESRQYPMRTALRIQLSIRALVKKKINKKK